MKRCRVCDSPVMGYADTCGGLACEASRTSTSTTDIPQDNHYFEISSEIGATTITYKNPQFKIKKTHLTQADIDRLDEKPGMYPSWWDATATLGTTILVMVCFAAGCYGLWLLWQLGGK